MTDATDKPIGHDEAAEIALKFINQHFNNPGKERPRASIPANPARDDDLRLMAYIRQQRALAAARASAGGVRVVRTLDTVVHVSGRRSALGVFDLEPGQSLAIISPCPSPPREVGEGHVMLPDGRLVKVLGTLPMTADGAIYGAGHPAVWLVGNPPARTWSSADDPTILGRPLLNKCYSTPEAASAPAQKGTP